MTSKTPTLGWAEKKEKKNKNQHHKTRLTPFFFYLLTCCYSTVQKIFCLWVSICICMSVCIYIYLYREKSYTTGLAFIKCSSGGWEKGGSRRTTQPQMNWSCPSLAKPAVCAAQSSREPVALLVPQGQQTRNANPQGLFLLWAALPAPGGAGDAGGAALPDLRSQRAEALAGAGDKMFLSALQVRSWVQQQGSDLARALLSASASGPAAAQVPCSRNKYPHNHTNPSFWIYIYIHTHVHTVSS